MKLPKFLASLVICFFSSHFSAQITTFTTPYSLCVSQTVLATASSTIPSSMVGSYSWSVSPAESIVSFNPQNTAVVITYTSCGPHILYCSTLDNSNQPIANGDASLTVYVACSPPPVVSIIPTAYSVCPGFTSTLTAFGANTYTWYPGGTNQPSLSVGAGSYTVGGTNLTGCVDLEVIQIAALPPLSISFSQSSSLTCIASNAPKFSKAVTLNATGGAANYAWLPYNEVSNPIGPVTLVRPAASKCYTLIGTTAVCSGSALVCVSVTPQFSIGVTPPLPVMCIGDQINLSVSSVGLPSTGPASAFSYSWTEALNAPPISMSNYLTPTVTVFPQNSTTYTVEVLDAVGCLSIPRQVSVSVFICTELNKEQQSKMGLSIFPNPMQEKLTIKSDRSVNVTIEITDVFGKILITENVTLNAGMDREINTSSFAKGIYFIDVSGDKENARTFRIIKE